jgi:hypothetical protein
MLAEKERQMAFEDKEAELGLLLTQMQNEPDDWHELYQEIRLKLNELKAFGMPLPADLVQFEHDLEAEFDEEKADAETVAQYNEDAASRTMLSVPVLPKRSQPASFFWRRTTRRMSRARYCSSMVE